jgi:hypothetical protein
MHHETIRGEDLAWRRCVACIGGLHENDLIIAARIDALLRSEHPGDSD